MIPFTCIKGQYFRLSAALRNWSLPIKNEISSLCLPIQCSFLLYNSLWKGPICLSFHLQQRRLLFCSPWPQNPFGEDCGLIFFASFLRKSFKKALRRRYKNTKARVNIWKRATLESGFVTILLWVRRTDFFAGRNVHVVSQSAGNAFLTTILQPQREPPSLVIIAKSSL